MDKRIVIRRAATLLALAAVVAVHAEPAPFDLAGPHLQVQVNRGPATLPIGQVPNLAAGDKLWIRADLPASQSAHYLMVVAFLRGSTNPPPEDWFYRCETWSKPCVQQGLTVTIPDDAQQVLVFLAPQSGGDFRTLVNAVRGRPGAFVRASQDLNQASLDRSRLESHLTALRALNQRDPGRLKEAAPLLARSLSIKLDEKCLDRLPQLQAPCLMQGQNSLILNDGHSTSIVEALTSGPASDLAMEASYTPQLSYGYYSPYIASVLDIARILDSFHTAQYQYIPALATQQGEQLSLTLNVAPSFRNPKSVLVTALPAVERAQLPPLHAVDPKEIYCARRSVLVLPVEGAPLVFSTGYAHDVSLKLEGKDGQALELPAKADAEQGGFIVNTESLGSAHLGDRIHGSIHGFWGFESYAGPGFELVNAHAQTWELAAADAGALIVGRDDTVHLQAGSVSCVDGIMLKDPTGKELKADWKTVKPNEVEVKLPLEGVQPGAITLLVTQHGAKDPQPIQLHAFSEAAHLEHFVVHAGEAQGTLQGSRLDEVASLTFKEVEFLPGVLTTRGGNDELSLTAQDARVAAGLTPGEVAKAKVVLKDGRVLALNTTVDGRRPSVALIAKNVQLSAVSGSSNIQLADQELLPQDAKLTFSVRAQSPAAFGRDEQIEVATTDGAASTLLSIANGGVMLEDSKVAVATLDPARQFGASVFGPLQFRVVVANGVTGDWHPLATLVRLPVLKELKCPATPDLACKLSGSNLFLVDSVAGDAKFDHAVQVPDGFPGYTLPVPHPTDGQLYVKLRDDPAIVNLAALGAQQMPPTREEEVRAPARHAAAQPPSAAQPENSAPNPTSGPQKPVPTPAGSSGPENAAPPPGASVPTASLPNLAGLPATPPLSDP